MKRLMVLFLTTALMIAGCKSVSNNENEDSTGTSTELSEGNSNASEKKDEIDLGEPDMTNLTYDNGSGKMGDTDGPAYAIYSKKGYNKASIDVKISGIDINNIRKSDGKFVNAYIFLGMDIYDTNGNWINCLDTGFCYSGKNGGWHLFYNLYAVQDKNTQKWYESTVILNPTHDYKLTLDSSKQNGFSIVSIFDLTDDMVVDSKEFESAYSLADGSNTAYLQNYALDYPGDVKYDTQGNKSVNDYIEITLFNTDESLYMKNVTVENALIYKSGKAAAWTEQHTQNRSLWPDCNMGIDYPVVKIWVNSLDDNFILSLDMNR